MLFKMLAYRCKSPHRTNFKQFLCKYWVANMCVKVGI